MPTTTAAKIIATLRFLSESGVDGRALHVRNSAEPPRAEAHDGGDEEQDDEAGQHQSERYGALAAAAHILRRKGSLIHDLVHPNTGAKGARPRTRSAMISAKRAKR